MSSDVLWVLAVVGWRTLLFEDVTLLLPERKVGAGGGRIVIIVDRMFY